MYYLLLVPMEVVPKGLTTVRRAKYLSTTPSLAGVQYGLIDYGLIDIALVAADLTTTQWNNLRGNADVYSFHPNLDRNVGGYRNQVREALEAVRLPGNWIEEDTTFRDVARAVAGVMTFGQRHAALHGEELIPNRAALSLTWEEIALDRRTRILETAASLDYDLGWIIDTMTVRAILRELIVQWGERNFSIATFVF